MNRTPTQTACTDAHSVSQHILNIMITFHHANTRGSRLHIFVPQNSCHPHVMSRSLPHLTLTTSTSSLTYLTYLSDVLSLTPESFAARSVFTLRRFTAEWRINTNPISHRLYEPKVIEPEDLELGRIELDRNLGTDPYQTQSPKIWMNLLPVEGKRPMFERETNAVSGMRVTIMHKNRHRKPPHLLSHQ